MPDRPDRLLVKRIFQVYGASWFKRFQGLTVEQLRAWPPVLEHMPEDERQGPAHPRNKRMRAYDFGRVRYFVDLLLDGKELDPIELDNVCDGGNIYPEIVMEDGHHRLMAYKLAGREKIPTSYSGRIDLLNYLKGKRKTYPT